MQRVSETLRSAWDRTPEFIRDDWRGWGGVVALAVGGVAALFSRTRKGGVGAAIAGAAMLVWRYVTGEGGLTGSNTERDVDPDAPPTSKRLGQLAKNPTRDVPHSEIQEIARGLANDESAEKAFQTLWVLHEAHPQGTSLLQTVFLQLEKEKGGVGAFGLWLRNRLVAADACTDTERRMVLALAGATRVPPKPALTVALHQPDEVLQRVAIAGLDRAAALEKELRTPVVEALQHASSLIVEGAKEEHAQLLERLTYQPPPPTPPKEELGTHTIHSEVIRMVNQHLEGGIAGGEGGNMSDFMSDFDRSWAKLSPFDPAKGPVVLTGAPSVSLQDVDGLVAGKEWSPAMGRPVYLETSPGPLNAKLQIVIRLAAETRARDGRYIDTTGDMKGNVLFPPQTRFVIRRTSDTPLMVYEAARVDSRARFVPAKRSPGVRIELEELPD
jgi:hypothetical protein